MKLIHLGDGINSPWSWIAFTLELDSTHLGVG